MFLLALSLYAAVYQGRNCIHPSGRYYRLSEKNNGYYTVSPGKMIQGYQMGKEYVCVTISELTALVLKRPSSLYEPDAGLIFKAHLHS